MRIPATSIFVVAFAASAFAQDGIKKEKMAEIKAASVFIRNQSGPYNSSGSGFVVSSTDEYLLIATNAHVVDSEHMNDKVYWETLKMVNYAKFTVLFDSGTVNERSAKAVVMAYDPTADIAIMRVKTADVKNPPKALKIAGAKELDETSTVYSFGFPFGDKLSTGKGPAITVGKATVSSLRTDELGKLKTIQIDGNLNPGNSGGPVTDVEGTVIGVATATIRDSHGIGLIVPVAEINANLNGKVIQVNLAYQMQKDGTLKVVFEVFLSNPSGQFKNVDLNYVLADAKAERPKPDADLKALPGSKTVQLKLTGTVAKSEVAKGEVILDKTDGYFIYNLKANGGDHTGANVFVSLARAARGRQGIDADAKTPAGWKQISSKDGQCTCWVPEKSKKPIDREVTFRTLFQTATINSVQTAGENGLTYVLEHASVVNSESGKAANQAEMNYVLSTILETMTEGLEGRIAEELDAKLGNLAGKELTIKGRKSSMMVRIVISGSDLYLLGIHGPTADVERDDDLFLNSFRQRPGKKPDTVAVVPDKGTTTTPPPVTIKPADDFSFEKAIAKPAQVKVAKIDSYKLEANTDKPQFAQIPDVFTKNKAVIYSKPKDKHSGLADITVTAEGYLFLACKYGNEGNNAGGWMATRWTAEQFATNGWHKIDPKDVGGGFVEGKETLALFVKFVKKGAELKLRCNKYSPPYAIVFEPGPTNKVPVKESGPNLNVGIKKGDSWAGPNSDWSGEIKLLTIAITDGKAFNGQLELRDGRVYEIKGTITDKTITFDTEKKAGNSFERHYVGEFEGETIRLDWKGVGRENDIRSGKVELKASK